MRISDWSSDVCSSDLRRDLSTGFLKFLCRSRIFFPGVPILPVSACVAIMGWAVQMTEVALRVDDVANPLLEVLRAGKAAVALAFPQKHSVDADLEIAARARNERHFAEARSEEHTSELQSLMRISYALF